MAFCQGLFYFFFNYFRESEKDILLAFGFHELGNFG